MRLAFIAVAGSLGAVARYLLDGIVSARIRGAFPWGTLVVNLSGCFLLGLMFTVLTGRALPHPAVRTAITVGFLGAYTTFSTFSLETLRLAQEGAVALALANVAASVGAGLFAAWAGVVAGRVL